MSEFHLWVSVSQAKPSRAPLKKGDLLSSWSHLPSQAQAHTAPPTAIESWWQNSAQGLARSGTNNKSFLSSPNSLIPYHSHSVKYLPLFTLSTALKIQKSSNTYDLNNQRIPLKVIFWKCPLKGPPFIVLYLTHLCYVMYLTTDVMNKQAKLYFKGIWLWLHFI